METLLEICELVNLEVFLAAKEVEESLTAGRTVDVSSERGVRKGGRSHFCMSTLHTHLFEPPG